MEEYEPRTIQLLEICENGGVGEVRIDGKQVKNLECYTIKRGTDFSEITLTISVPTRKLRTFTKESVS